MHTAESAEQVDVDYDDILFAIKCINTSGKARELRENAGISRYELARRVGTFPPYIQRWENDETRPSLRNLELLAAYGRELRRLQHRSFSS